MKEFRISAKAEEVDQVTNLSIAKRYPMEDEIKLLRRAVFELAKGRPLPDDFVTYYNFVERVVTKRRKLKK